MRTGTGAHGYVCPQTRKYRNLDLAAVAEIAAVGNELYEVGFIAHPFVYGVPEITADIHVLDSPHTLKHCREQLAPKSFMRQDRDTHEASGRRTAFDQAQEITLHAILNAPPQGVLGEDANRDIADVIATADRHILSAAAAHKGAVEVI
jgi:hypothetical protein